MMTARATIIDLMMVPSVVIFATKAGRHFDCDCHRLSVGARWHGDGVVDLSGK